MFHKHTEQQPYRLDLNSDSVSNDRIIINRNHMLTVEITQICFGLICFLFNFNFFFLVQTLSIRPDFVPFLLGTHVFYVFQRYTRKNPRNYHK